MNIYRTLRDKFPRSVKALTWVTVLIGLLGGTALAGSFIAWKVYESEIRSASQAFGPDAPPAPGISERIDR